MPANGLRRITGLYRTLALKLVLLAAVFLALPVLFYRVFETANVAQLGVLRTAIETQGALIASLLRPHLGAFREEAPEALQGVLDDLADEETTIKLLLRSKDQLDADGFLYIAASPAVSAEYLDRERGTLVESGIFERLAESCDSDTGSGARIVNPAGRPELLTAIAARHIGDSCWVIILSHTAKPILDSSIGRPFWSTPAVRMVLVMYLLGAAAGGWLLADVWRSLRRFRLAARRIRLQEAGGGTSFCIANTVPELAGVAEDFDALVSALNRSKTFIIQAAEENAHAFKGPLAVIAQALEPIRRVVPSSNHDARRSLELIEHSAARLNILVAEARNLGHEMAEEVYPELRRLDLSVCLAQLLAAFETSLASEDKSIHAVIERDIQVYATEEAVESVVENLLENAASFSEAGETIEVLLNIFDGYAHLTVADRGPGMRPSDLPHVFERRFTTRGRRDGGAVIAVATTDHSGLGLWIVRRTIEGLSGKATARNRHGGGFSVTVSFKTAE